jgi:hypothetical protein
MEDCPTALIGNVSDMLRAPGKLAGMEANILDKETRYITSSITHCPRQASIRLPPHERVAATQGSYHAGMGVSIFHDAGAFPAVAYHTPALISELLCHIGKLEDKVIKIEETQESRIPRISKRKNETGLPPKEKTVVRP